MIAKTNTIVIAVTIFVVALSVINYVEAFGTNEVTYIKSTVDGRKYLVRNLDDSEEAANLLANLRTKLKKIVSSIRTKHKDSISVERLSIKFKPNNLTESTPDSKFTSYSVNKGQKIVFCIRERDEKNRLVDLNTITFVALHELAHVMTLGIGHKKEFWDNFRFLLKFAIDNGFYKYQAFHLEPVRYCNTTIADTPLKLESN
jgi:predicted metal-dependent hydrolase